MKSYRIPEENLASLEQRMEKLIRRCRRAKIEAPVLTRGAFEDIAYKNEDGFDRVRRYYTVTLESAGRPKIEGYEFAAVISPVTDEDGKVLGNILRRVPGFTDDVPLHFRQATNYCDHCKTERRRLETFVIASEAGFRQIGRNCLANYLGLTDPDTLALIAEILIDADELASDSERDGFGGGRTPERVSLEEVLQTAASAIRQHGWLSNKSAQEHQKTSTSGRVREWVFGNSKDRKNMEHQLTANDDDKALATKTLEWLESLTNTEQTEDYRFSLSLLAKSSSITAKNFGIAVSAINAYSKEMEFQIRRNARIEADSKSEFIGQIGERVKFENVTVIYTTTFETQFGVTHLLKMKQGDNVIVYFASNKLFEQGEVVSFTARIKAHETRVDKYNENGVKQTVITRATLPKPELTEDQKKAKKVALKLRRIAKTLPHTAEDSRTGKGDHNDYQAWCTVNDLAWQIEREAKL